MNSLKGSCLCGSVHFEVQPIFGVYRYCFCNYCRKNRGTRHAANILVSPDDFTWIKGEESVSRYELTGTRFGNCFCVNCGTPMPRHTLSGRSVVIPIGVLDDDPGEVPVHVVFWDFRVSWLPEESTMEKYSDFADE